MLVKKEQMEEKMKGIREMKCRAVTCKKVTGALSWSPCVFHLPVQYIIEQRYRRGAGYGKVSANFMASRFLFASSAATPTSNRLNAAWSRITSCGGTTPSSVSSNVPVGRGPSLWTGCPTNTASKTPESLHSPVCDPSC